MIYIVQYGAVWRHSPSVKIETPNDRLHFGFKKSNGLYFGLEVGLMRKKCQTLLLSSTGKA
ncbi:hypothetical protein CI711_04955 [Shigella boydii]|nr:hypothetical protein [Escherichia coli]EFN4444741.1 hypothetical protein [Escherichia coli]PBO97288.1 hypothetical protein CI711_04955 [Shigella boydii]RRB72143.1 hypothetical protein EIA19_20225 [Escherichia coli]RRC06418.1 hypothetical protein EIA12_21635 [Escherichia coli]